MNMEELRSASMAYYKNSSKKLKKKAKKFFRSMDANRDDRVSLAEFASFLQQKGYGEIEHNMFRQLDANGDGELDFDEVLTFYYIVKTRGLWCDVCHSRLTGLHFSCVTCFENGRNSFDLCSSCYGNGRFNHPHNIFLDSHVLLRSKKGRPGADVNMALTQPQLPPQPHNHSNWETSFDAMEIALLGVQTGVRASPMETLSWRLAPIWCKNQLQRHSISHTILVWRNSVTPNLV